MQSFVVQKVAKVAKTPQIILPYIDVGWFLHRFICQNPETFQKHDVFQINIKKCGFSTKTPQRRAKPFSVTPLYFPDILVFSVRKRDLHIFANDLHLTLFNKKISHLCSKNVTESVRCRKKGLFAKPKFFFFQTRKIYQNQK